MTDAFTHSINTAAVHLAEEVGYDQILAMARRLGLSSVLHRHPSLALGSGLVATPACPEAMPGELCSGGKKAVNNFSKPGRALIVRLMLSMPVRPALSVTEAVMVCAPGESRAAGIAPTWRSRLMTPAVTVCLRPFVYHSAA